MWSDLCELWCEKRLSRYIRRLWHKQCDCVWDRRRTFNRISWTLQERQQVCHGPPDHIERTFLNKAKAVQLFQEDEHMLEVKSGKQFFFCSLIIWSLKLENTIPQTNMYHNSINKRQKMNKNQLSTHAINLLRVLKNQKLCSAWFISLFMSTFIKRSLVDILISSDVNAINLGMIKMFVPWLILIDFLKLLMLYKRTAPL